MPIIHVDTTGSKAMTEKSYQPYTQWRYLDESIIKLPCDYSFDILRLQKQISEIEKDFEYRCFTIDNRSKKQRKTYRGLGITHRPGATDPYYDALGQFSKSGALNINETFNKQSMLLPVEKRDVEKTFEADFTQKNSLYSGYLKEILDRFKSPITKTRLSQLLPNGLISSHIDFPYYEQIRVHTVLSTNEDCWWSIDGKKFQLPVDGNFYWFDTGKYHSVWNDGPTPRLVLSVNLSVYKDHNGQTRYTHEQNLSDLIASGLI